MPWAIAKRGDEYCVYKEDADGNPTGESLGCHNSRKQAEKQMSALYANVEETGAAGFDIVQESTLGTFRGNFPHVPIAEGVDIDAIGQRDAEPLYVTLPIVPKVGSVSKNGLLYDEHLLEQIESQIIERRPGANFGHLSRDQLETAFPKPEALWVGAKRVGDTLWGKAYVRPGAARDYIRDLRDMGGSISTSIMGKGKHEQVAKGVKRITDFDLETLDFAPPSRAALSRGAVPILTAEMESDGEGIVRDNIMEKEELIAELTVGDIPEKLRQEIIEVAAEQDKTVERLSELETNIKDRDAMIAELTTAVAEYRDKEFNHALDGRIAELFDWSVTGEEAKEKVETFQRILRSRVVSELAGDREEEKIDETIQTVWEELKPLAETVRDALAGPPAITGGKTPKAKLDTSPEAVADALRKFSLT